MKSNSDALNVVAHTHTDPGRKPLSHSVDQEPWSGLDPARLIDLLESIDGLKHEVQERMRRIEAVNQAKILLQEDARRTEALNRKLSELGRAFGEARHEPSLHEVRNREADLLRMPARELAIEIPARSTEPTVSVNPSQLREHIKTLELLTVVDSEERTSAGLEAQQEPVQRLADALQIETSPPPVEKVPPLEPALAPVKAPSETSASETPDSYRDAAQRFTEISLERQESIESAIEARAMYEEARQQLEQARQTMAEISEALENAKHTFEQSTAQLNLARSKEEAAMADLKSAQQDLTTAYQFAAVAAQRQHDASEFFRKSNRWTIVALTTSWIVLSWVAWLQFRSLIPAWAPAALSLLIVGLVILVSHWGTKRE